VREVGPKGLGHADGRAIMLLHAGRRTPDESRCVGGHHVIVVGEPTGRQDYPTSRAYCHLGAVLLGEDPDHAPQSGAGGEVDHRTLVLLQARVAGPHQPERGVEATSNLLWGRPHRPLPKSWTDGGSDREQKGSLEIGAVQFVQQREGRGVTRLALTSDERDGAVWARR